MNKEKYKKMSKTKIIILTFIILLAACSSNKKKSYEEYAFSGRTTRTENMRKYAFSMIQYSFNMLKDRNTSCDK